LNIAEQTTWICWYHCLLVCDFTSNKYRERQGSNWTSSWLFGWLV